LRRFADHPNVETPCNAVFRAGVPVALIDFDAACPGTRAFDLGYAAWLWLDWGNTEWSAADQLRRLRLFLSSYGPGPTESEVIESAIRRQSIVMAAGVRTGNADMTKWASDCQQWTLSHMRPAIATTSAPT
jgi:aminoglycoside phosphotransferase (APT) family kinase protein